MKNVMSEKNAEIVFPHEWEYRIFCASAGFETVKSAVAGSVEKMKLSGLELSDGGVSGSGTYRSLRLTVVVSSLDEANQLGAEIKKIDGVRFIL